MYCEGASRCAVAAHLLLLFASLSPGPCSDGLLLLLMLLLRCLLLLLLLSWLLLLLLLLLILLLLLCFPLILPRRGGGGCIFKRLTAREGSLHGAGDRGPAVPAIESGSRSARGRSEGEVLPLTKTALEGVPLSAL